MDWLAKLIDPSDQQPDYLFNILRNIRFNILDWRAISLNVAVNVSVSQGLRHVNLGLGNAKPRRNPLIRPPIKGCQGNAESQDRLYRLILRNFQR